MRTNIASKLYLFLLLFFFLFCSGEVSLTKEGYERELNGNKAEALFYYNLALEKDRDYFLANKRIGLLLSESLDSITSAIYHLEKARLKESKDKDVLFKLLDLYFITGDSDKVNKLLQESKKVITTTEQELIKELISCIFSNEKKKVDIKEWSKKDNLNNYPQFKNSVLVCLKSNGIEEIPERLLEKK